MPPFADLTMADQHQRLGDYPINVHSISALNIFYCPINVSDKNLLSVQSIQMLEPSGLPYIISVQKNSPLNQSQRKSFF